MLALMLLVVSQIQEPGYGVDASLVREEMEPNRSPNRGLSAISHHIGIDTYDCYQSYRTHTPSGRIDALRFSLQGA